MPTLEEQIAALNESLNSQQAPVLPTLPRGTPDDGTRPGLLGRIGEVLAGGQSPTYRLRGREEDAAGSRALLNFGLNMLMASGPSRVRPDLLTAAATGLQGAQQSMDLDQRRAAAVAQQDYQQRMELAKLGVEQNRDKIERLKAGLSLLTLQQQEKQRQAYLNGAGGGGAGGGAGAAAPTGGTPFIAKNLPPGVTPEEDQIVRTVWGEANGQPLAGQQAVAHVIKTRAKASGQSTQDVIFAPHQFEPWNTARRSQLEGLDPTSPEYQRILQQVVRPVMTGQAQDPTGGATHFLNPALVKSRGDEIPGWASGNRTTIGAHDFYYSGYGPRGGTTPPPAGPPGARGTQVATAKPTTATDATPAPVPAATGATTPPPDAAAPAQPAVPGQPPAPGQGQAAIPTYTRPHPFEPTLAGPPDDPRFATVLPQPVEEDFRRRLQLNESQMRTRIATAPAADLDKIVGEHDKLKQDILKDRTAALGAVLKEQGTSVGAWQKEERDRLFQVWKDERYPAEPSDLAAAKITPQPGVIYQVDNQGNIHQQKVEVDPRLQRQAEQDYKTFQDNYQQPYTQLIKIRPVMDQMDALRQRIIRNGGAGTGLSGEHLRQVQQVAASLGFSSENFGNLNDVQVLESLANQVVLAMKQGVALGNVSNLDLQIVGSQVPTMMQTLSGQEKLSSVLRQIWDYQEKVYKVANKEIRNPGTGYTLRDLDQKVAEAGPAIPLLPAESEKWDKKQFEDWRTQHKLRKGQVYYTPGGDIATVTK